MQRQVRASRLPSDASGPYTCGPLTGVLGRLDPEHAYQQRDTRLIAASELLKAVGALI